MGAAEIRQHDQIRPRHRDRPTSAHWARRGWCSDTTRRIQRLHWRMRVTRRMASMTTHTPQGRHWRNSRHSNPAGDCQDSEQRARSALLLRSGIRQLKKRSKPASTSVRTFSFCCLPAVGFRSLSSAVLQRAIRQLPFNSRSIRSAHRDDGGNGLSENLQVEQATPLARIIPIEEHAPFEPDVATP